MQTISVGFGRAVITPKETVGLKMEGYSNQISQGVYTEMLGTCIAITDEVGNTMLLYTVDRCECNKTPVNELRKRLSAAYGIARDNITVCATHSHSTPVIESLPDYVDQLYKAGEEALADRAPATIQIGSHDVPDMNWNRHYILTDGTMSGDNYGERFAGHVLAALKNLKDVEGGSVAGRKTPLGDRGFELHAYRLGKYIGFATAPAEIFHETGTAVREGSPFQLTFFLSCANGRDTYIPIESAWDYKSNNTIPYEVRICRYPRGTAEILTKDLVGMLKVLAQ